MGFAFADNIHAQAAAGAGGRKGGRERLLRLVPSSPELGMLLSPGGEWKSWAERRERDEKERWSLGLTGRGCE